MEQPSLIGRWAPLGEPPPDKAVVLDVRADGTFAQTKRRPNDGRELLLTGTWEARGAGLARFTRADGGGDARGELSGDGRVLAVLPAGRDRPVEFGRIA